MEQIKIDRPFSILMTVIEKDDYLPSFKVEFKSRIEHPTGVFTYEANDIWFQCSIWDNFVDQLSELDNTKTTASLLNLNDYFSIQIVKRDDEIYFEFLSKEIIPGFGLANISSSVRIDRDILAIIKRNFHSFEKWW